MKFFSTREKRLKNMTNGYINKKQLRGANTRCPWLPCHSKDLQDCTFCVCPFYPCQDTDLGSWYHYEKNGEPFRVWDCTNCGLPHRKDIAQKLIQDIQDVGDQKGNMRLFPQYKSNYQSNIFKPEV